MRLVSPLFRPLYLSVRAWVYECNSNDFAFYLLNFYFLPLTFSQRPFSYKSGARTSSKYDYHLFLSTIHILTNLVPKKLCGKNFESFSKLLNDRMPQNGKGSFVVRVPRTALVGRTRICKIDVFAFSFTFIATPECSVFAWFLLLFYFGCTMNCESSSQY